MAVRVGSRRHLLLLVGLAVVVVGSGIGLRDPWGYAGHDRERNLFLVDARMDPGRCAAQPIRRLYRFRWERPYW